MRQSAPRSPLLARALSLAIGEAPERPPGPRDPTGLLMAARLYAGTLQMLRELTDSYGDVVYFKLLGADFYLLNHPSDIEEAFARQAQAMARDEYSETLERTLGLGLLTSDGELWRRQRKLMARRSRPSASATTARPWSPSPVAASRCATARSSTFTPS